MQIQQRCVQEYQNNPPGHQSGRHPVQLYSQGSCIKTSLKPHCKMVTDTIHRLSAPALAETRVSPVKSLGGKLFVEDDTLQEGKREVDAQELNLLYVAASRAKSRLLLNDDVDNYLRLGGRGLQREPRPPLQYVKDNFSCISCQKPYNSCLAIISGRWNDSEDSSNNDPTSLDDSLLESPSSPTVQILETIPFQ
ncbi:unnamed protein product [Calypogeia fissa]